jgi:hypothetical protein
MRFSELAVVFVVLAIAQCAIAAQETTPTLQTGVESPASLEDYTVTTGTAVRATEEEETLPQFETVPPLGLDEAMQSVAASIYFLEKPDAKFLDYKKQKVTEALNNVTDYMKIIDDRHSTLENYRWYFVGKQKVSHGGIDEDTYVVEPPLRRVSAISFVAERGDVTIHRMTVNDVKGNQTKFTIERLIRADLPRKEVCFLYYQQSVAQVTLYYSTNDETVDPRVKVYCGVTPVPEYAKEAIYYLTLAKKELAEDHISETIKNLQLAWKRMLKIEQSWLRE